MSSIRAFIAFKLPSQVRETLKESIAFLNGQVPDHSVRWVKPELMHITLRFLGETAESSLPAIYAALDNLAEHHDPLRLNLDKLGCFPNCSRPRVIWAGLQGDVQQASALKRDLEEVLQNLGWEPEDRPFRAHITIGRVKTKLQIKNTITKFNLQNGPIQIKELHLIQSNLTSQGPIYTTRHTSNLNSSK